MHLRKDALEELIGALGGAPRSNGGAGSPGPSGRAGTSGAAGGTPESDLVVGSAASSASAPEPTTTASEPPEPEASEGLETVIREESTNPEAVEPTDDIGEAWRRWLDSGRGMPPGLRAFLHSAAVSEDGSGALVIAPLPGPAVDRLGQATAIEAIREGMTPFLGRRPVLRIDAPSSGEVRPDRISREEVHADTLKALYRQEPRLERAVEELDLELME